MSCIISVRLFALLMWHWCSSFCKYLMRDNSFFLAISVSNQLANVQDFHGTGFNLWYNKAVLQGALDVNKIEKL